MDKNDYDFFPKEQADFSREKDRDCLASGAVIDIPEEPILTKFLGMRILHTRKVPLYEKKQSPLALLGISEDITDQKLAKDALVESERRYKSLYSLIRLMCDNVPDLIWAKDLDGKFLFVNRAMCENMLNATDTEEPIGKTDLFFADRERSAHAENPEWHNFGEICVNSDQVVMSTKKAGKFDEFGNVKGEFLHLDVYKAPFRNQQDEMIGTVGCGRVVTEEKRLQDALRRKADEQSLLLDNIDTQIWFLSYTDTYGRVNKAHAEFMGRPPENFENKSLYEIVTKEVADVWVAGNVGVFDNKKRVRTAEWVMNGKGEPRLLAITRTPKLDDTGSVEFVICSAEDITDRKRLEQLLLQSERFRAVADLAGGVAHNFNNLLQIIIGNLELALMDLEWGNYTAIKDSLGKVLESSRFGAETVRRLQSFAGIRDHSRLPEKGAFDLSGIVRQAVEMSKTWWKTIPEKQGIKVSMEMELQERCLVQCEKNELFEVVVNLLKNAVEALPQGGTIDVETRVEGEQVVVKVRDTGVGISDQNLKRIFNPFFTTKARAGSGLGLASSRKIIEDSGGTIFVNSAEGKGTTITVLLPLAIEEPKPPKTQRTPATGQQLTVLVIDDEEAMLDLLKNALTRHNCEVFVALSGEKGLDIFKENHVDLVICDLGMPEMNGWQVGKGIQAICQERGIKKTPFMLLTGWGGQKTELEKMAESGVDVVMEKPLNVENMMEAIREVFEKRLSKDSGE